MIYVVLATVDLQLERIRQRVRDGGHDVPSDKVLDRRRRSFEELCWFAPQVDQLDADQEHHRRQDRLGHVLERCSEEEQHDQDDHTGGELGQLGAGAGALALRRRKRVE